MKFDQKEQKNDNELMLEVKSGSLESFETLVIQFTKGITNYFFRLCWDKGYSEDLCQEVFLKIWKNRENYKTSAKFTTYIFRIAVNLWIDECRKKSCRPTVDTDEYLDYLNGNNSSSEVETVVESRETILALKKALTNIEDSHRIPYILSVFHGKSYEEISQILGVPVGTVKSRKYYAVLKLRSELKGILRKKEIKE